MSLVDTHCHLNFKAFEGGQSKIIRRAKDVGVDLFVIPGTDIKTSQHAVKLASEHEDAFAVVGVHPHHIHQYPIEEFEQAWSEDILTIKSMLGERKVVGVGEIGLDRHTYFASRHGSGVEITQDMIEIQKKMFLSQVMLAVECGKSVVIHNREAKQDLVDCINSNQKTFEQFANKLVFHCCEADRDMLETARKLHFFIGVDGDVTFDEGKQSFIREVPLEILVLETDSPYILPEPLKSQKKFPNTPASIPLIAQAVASIKNIEISKVEEVTTQNAYELFGITKI